MPIVPSFSTQQTIGLPSIITFTDTSTGSDVAVTQRRIYLYTNDGTALVPSGTLTTYVSWALANSTISVDVLTKDYALNIIVQWLSATNVILYSSSQLLVFTLYNKTFYYSLTQLQSSTPSIVQDKNYYDNKAKLWTAITSAENAVTIGGDIQGAQLAIDTATYLTDNENLFF